MSEVERFRFICFDRKWYMIPDRRVDEFNDYCAYQENRGIDAEDLFADYRIVDPSVISFESPREDSMWDRKWEVQT